MISKQSLKNRVTVNLSQEQYIQLQELSFKDGLPIALIIRQALSSYLKDKKAKNSSIVNE